MHATPDFRPADAEHDLTPSLVVHPPGPPGPGAFEAAVATRAYEAFAGRGGVHGLDVEDWEAATWDVIADTLG